MKGKKMLRRMMGLALITTMLMPNALTNVLAAEHSVGKVYQEENTVREHINFNNDWKFYLGNVKDGQPLELDDSTWADIAIPHNFSVPYNMESSFYVGYGWYRKEFQLEGSLEGKQVALEFEGVFQAAEVYVNGEKVGTHEGGYTGFEYDITDYLTEGNNQIAIRVNNIWQPDLTPRAGDHQFTGGIYRDVYLNITDDVHVTWYGTFVTTPDLTNPGFDKSAVNVLGSYPSEAEIMENIQKKQSNVRVQTEVKNDSDTEKTIWVKQQVVDEDALVIAEFSSEKETVQPGDIYNFDAVSEKIKDIKIWDTENPDLYTVYTTVYSDEKAVDTYESAFGFRWAQYRDDGFYLNGEYTLLNGANVHQDHGGWADAVTNSGFARDVAMIKEAGMNFIRGSHYPHDPSFAEACDKEGILFWSESVFWGMGGCAGKDGAATLNAADWFKDAYPQNPADEANFEESCLQALTDMIRVNRNHPSIINWSMGNEVFFTASGTQQKAKNLVNKMRNQAHLLDPTRKSGMGGVQRENYDSLDICDIAGYNGDGGKITNTWMPNIVAEYGSKTANRPGEYRPFYDQIAVGGTNDKYQLTTNSAGLSLWCAFHHGTIGGDGLAKMGVIDYYRLPLNSWYWYREHYTGVAPEQSISGTAAQLQLTASADVMTNDGTEDVQVVVTMLDDAGNWVNETKKVTLEVISGPGVFPTGKEYTFIPNSTIYDGKAAIEFRSYYPGETVIRATASGVEPAELTLTTLNVTGTIEEEPEGFYVMPEPDDNTAKIADPMLYGTSNVASGRPAFPSSNDADRTLVVDGDPSTTWVAGKSGSGEYWMSDLEFAQYVYKVKLDFAEEPYPYKVEVAMDKDAAEWTTVAEYTKETIGDRPYEESVNGVEARYVRVTFTDVPSGEYAFLSECEIYGVTSSQSPQYEAEWAYLSDLNAVSESTGWGTLGKDTSCEGNVISVGGVSYEKGLGLHANSVVTYDLDEKYTRFQAYAGIDDEVGTNVGDAIFQVYADGTLIYEENLKTGDSDFVDLSVSGVSELKLITTNNGVDSNDHTDWADAKVLGAIRETTKSGSGYEVNFTSNTQELHPGELFKVNIGLKNKDSVKNDYSAALCLYDGESSLIDMVVVNDYLSKGKSTVLEMKMGISEDFTNGKLHVNVWNTNTLELISKTVVISTSQKENTSQGGQSEKVVWNKVDGEDMKKVGNWKVWTDNKAYKTTETYTGDGDSPLTDDVSISYTFTGNQFRIGAKVDRSQVGAEVYLDGEYVALIDNKATIEMNEYQLVYESEKLENKEHTVKLIPIGKFGVDYLEYSVPGNVEPPRDEQVYPGTAVENFFALIETVDMTLYTKESCQKIADAMEEILNKYKAGKTDDQAYADSCVSLQEAIDELETVDVLPYVDVEKEDWFYDEVAYTYKKGLMTGMNPTHFGPYGQLSRAQFALILYRMEGQPKTITEKSFGDIAGDEWYGTAVLWAAEAGIVSGYLDGKFGPADNITREQMAVMMHRYAKYLGKDTMNKVSYDEFADAASVSGFAEEAMQWAVAEQIITGKESGTKLDPQGNTARCETAVMIQRFLD